jgi:hypothetical protein
LLAIWDGHEKVKQLLAQLMLEGELTRADVGPLQLALLGELPEHRAVAAVEILRKRLVGHGLDVPGAMLLALIKEQQKLAFG